MEELKEKRDELNSKTRELAEDKKKIAEQIRKLKETVRQERELRDKANEEVKSLKEKRVASFEEIKKLRKELDEIITILERLKGFVSGPYGLLKEELKQMEWDYQTGVQSIRKEKEMVKEIDALEKEIAKSEILYDKKKNLIRLQRKLRDYYTEANVYHGLLLNRAKDSEKHHDAMMKSIKEINGLQKRFEKMDETLKKTREEADQCHKELIELKPEPKKQEENMEELMKKAQEILANFKNGKKITTEELDLLQNLGLY